MITSVLYKISLTLLQALKSYPFFWNNSVVIGHSSSMCLTDKIFFTNACRGLLKCYGTCVIHFQNVGQLECWSQYILVAMDEVIEHTHTTTQLIFVDYSMICWIEPKFLFPHGNAQSTARIVIYSFLRLGFFFLSRRRILDMFAMFFF